MDFSKLLENKPLLYGIIGGVVLVLAIIIIAISVAASNGGGGEGKTDLGGEPLKANVDLLTTDNVGKALEIQALLAKQGITVERQLDGTKSKLVLNKNNCSTLTKKCTVTDRDNAIITIVAFCIGFICLISLASSPFIALASLILLSSFVEVKSPLSKISSPTFWSTKNSDCSNCYACWRKT